MVTFWIEADDQLELDIVDTTVEYRVRRTKLTA